MRWPFSFLGFGMTDDDIDKSRAEYAEAFSAGESEDSGPVAKELDPQEAGKARVAEKDSEYLAAHAAIDKANDAERAPDHPAKYGSFKEAFAAKRKAGEKEFTWNGKSYSTDLASEKPAKEKAKPVSNAPVKSSEAKPTQSAQKSPQSAIPVPKVAKTPGEAFKPIGAADHGSDFAKRAFGKSA